jgi:hypothetical protein
VSDRQIVSGGLATEVVREGSLGCPFTIGSLLLVAVAGCASWTLWSGRCSRLALRGCVVHGEGQVSWALSGVPSWLQVSVSPVRVRSLSVDGVGLTGPVVVMLSRTWVPALSLATICSTVVYDEAG